MPKKLRVKNDLDEQEKSNNFESENLPLDIVKVEDVSSDESFMEPLVLEDEDEDANYNTSLLEDDIHIKSEPESEAAGYSMDSKNLDGPSSLDRDKKVATETNRRTCCSYCGEFFSNMILHLRGKHSRETDVREYLKSSKGLKERKHLMNLVRTKGNPNPETNSLSPFPSIKKIKTQTESSTISPQLKNVLFKIRLYKVFDVVRNDRMIIEFGNKHSKQTCIQLLLKQLHYLGLFLLEMKDRRIGVSELLDVFSSKHLKQCIWALKAIARFDPTSEKYKRHNVAFILSEALTEVATLALSFYESRADARTKEVASFIRKFSLEVTQINASLEKNKVRTAITKLCDSPLISDIVVLNRFLNDERRLCCRDLANGFRAHIWKKLVRFTLVSLKVLNPRREETERVKILEYYETLKPVETEELSPESREILKLCYSFKVSNRVSVLLHRELVVCIDYIVKYRSEAGVSTKNPYVFGFPSFSDDNYLYVQGYLKDFAVQCGATKPKSLKESSLRECLAFTISYNLQDLVHFVEREKRVECHDHSYCRVRIPWDDNSKVESVVSVLVNIQNVQELENEEESDEESDEEKEEHFENISIKEESEIKQELDEYPAENVIFVVENEAIVKIEQEDVKIEIIEEPKEEITIKTDLVALRSSTEEPKKGQKRKLERSCKKTVKSPSDDTTEDAKLKKILETVGTKGWTLEERMIIVNKFRPYFYINEYPKGWEISELIAKHNLEKSVTKVRSQIQNLKRHVQNGLIL